MCSILLFDNCCFVQFLDDSLDNFKDCKGLYYYYNRKLKEKVEREKNVKDIQVFVKKIFVIFQMFIIIQFGCGVGEFKRNMMKKIIKGNYWG